MSSINNRTLLLSTYTKYRKHSLIFDIEIISLLAESFNYIAQTTSDLSFFLVVGRLGRRVTLDGRGQKDDDNSAEYTPRRQQRHQPMTSDGVLWSEKVGKSINVYK